MTDSDKITIDRETAEQAANALLDLPLRTDREVIAEDLRAALAAQPADQELTRFEADLIESVGQMKRDEAARVWPAQPAEPVEWQFRYIDSERCQSTWINIRHDDVAAVKSLGYEVRNLCAAPPAPAAVPPKHMQIVRLWGDRSDGPGNQEIVAFARAVERAHGIGDKG